MMGPVDYVVLGFAGSSFDGSILGELEKAVKKNVIRVLDIVFIIKDKNGDVIEGEYADQSEELRSTMHMLDEDEGLPMLSDSDIEKLGSQMAPDTAAGVLVLEHLWAKNLKQAIVDADGFVIDEGRIHPELAEAAAAELTPVTV